MTPRWWLSGFYNKLANVLLNVRYNRPTSGKYAFRGDLAPHGSHQNKTSRTHANGVFDEFWPLAITAVWIPTGSFNWNCRASCNCRIFLLAVDRGDVASSKFIYLLLATFDTSTMISYYSACKSVFALLIPAIGVFSRMSSVDLFNMCVAARQSLDDSCAGILPSSVLGPVLFILYTADDTYIRLMSTCCSRHVFNESLFECVS